MKKTFLVLSVLAALGTGVFCDGAQAARRPAAAAAPAQRFGLGLVLGQPSGITTKYWQTDKFAWDAGLGYGTDNFFLLYGDLLFHFPGLFGTREQFLRELTPYLGFGGMFVVSTQTKTGTRHYFESRDSDIGIAARIPIGVEWRPKKIPLGVFLEIAPGVGLVPGTFGYVDGGIGVRYYFF